MIEILKELHKDIWETKQSTSRWGSFNIEARQLTTEEWETVKNAINQEQLAVHMINACFGFNCGIQLFQAPQYPDLELNLIIVITGKHLDKSFDAAWEEFSELAKNSENQKLLDFCKLPRLRNKGFYDY